MRYSPPWKKNCLQLRPEHADRPSSRASGLIEAAINKVATNAISVMAVNKVGKAKDS